MWRWESLVSRPMDGLTDLTACSCRAGARSELIDDTWSLAYPLLDHCFCGIDAKRGIGAALLAGGTAHSLTWGWGSLGNAKSDCPALSGVHA